MDLTPRKRVQIVDLSKHAKKSVREIRKEFKAIGNVVFTVQKQKFDFLQICWILWKVPINMHIT